MLTIIDLNAEMAKLRMLRGRTPETPEADRQGSFVRLAGTAGLISLRGVRVGPPVSVRSSVMVVLFYPCPGVRLQGSAPAPGLISPGAGALS